MAEILSTKGKSVGEITLAKEVFEVEPNMHLMHLALRRQLNNARQGSACAKTRAEVSGGGRKPWKQKGTGRARFGSTRNPIWRHGGIAFGRTGEENFTKKLSKTSKRVAVRQALSLQNADKRIITVANFTIKDGKTKEALKNLEAAKVGKNERVLLVLPEKDELTLRALNNLNNVKPVRPTYLNVFDILNADKVIISEKSLPEIENWLIGKEEA